jgi:2-succinyl-6-hydroxy-2,4-cyclohexadiene-1-carboxylate synthase
VKTLVLHGFAGSPRPFARFFPDAGAPDLPGHGGAADAISWEDALERLAPGDPVMVFGYSMGARLALALALRHPETVTKLILECGTAGIEDGAQRARRKTADDALADFIEREGMLKFVDRWEQHPTLASLLPFAAQLRPERVAHRPAGLASALRHLGVGAQPSYWGELEELRIPVRLITGARDEKFTALASRMLDLLPHAELITIPDCGHAPHVERPQAFVEALR